MPARHRLSETMGPISAMPATFIRFLKLLVSRFIEDQGLPNAASLTFNTLLSLVPLTAVSLAVFAAFPVSDRLADQVQDFVFKNFVPAAGEMVQSYLQEFAQSASRMTGPGTLFLVIVALLMMANIDTSFNTIFRVKRRRSFLGMFLVYWSILTLGPLLIGLSVVATSYLVSLPFFTDATTNKEVSHLLLRLMPFLLSAVAFTLLYMLVPNRRVAFVHALIGGMTAAVMFELAKQGFVIYVTSFPTYQAIYGALAVIPIFLFWIYLSWVVSLLGAEITYCLGIFKDQDRRDVSGRGGEMLLAFRLLEKLWEGQRKGLSLSAKELPDQLGMVSEERLELILGYLQEARLVLLTEEGKWALARDLSHVSLMDLYTAHEFTLPEAKLMEGLTETSDQSLAKLLGRLEKDMQGAMETSLENLYLGEVRTG